MKNTHKNCCEFFITLFITHLTEGNYFNDHYNDNEERHSIDHKVDIRAIQNGVCRLHRDTNNRRNIRLF